MSAIHKNTIFFFLISLVLLIPNASKAQEISLAGTRQFAIDREDVGVEEEWFKQNLNQETIQLPGSMAENIKGNDITLNTK